MAGQSEDCGCVENSRDRLVSGLHPLEAFKRAIDIGIAAKRRYDTQGIPITKCFDRAAPPVEWLPTRIPDAIPYYLPAPRSSCDFVQLEPTAIYRGLDVFDVSRSLQGTPSSARPLREDELIWDCSCGQVWYGRSSFLVVDDREIRTFRIGPIPPTLRPYAVINPIAGAPYQRRYGARTDLRALTAQLSREDEEDDGPLLVTWSCLHGDLYVRGALDQIPLAPVGCVLDTLKSSRARPTAPLPPSPRQNTGRSSYPRSSGIPSSSTYVPKKRKRVDSGPTASGQLHSTRTTTSAPHPPDDSSAVCGIDDCNTRISKSTWEVHLSTAHRISQDRWRSGAGCPHDCGDPKKHAAATYDSWATFKRHFKQKHAGQPDSVAVVCPEPGCKQRGLSRPDALLRHYQKTHPGLTPPRERRRAGASSGGNNKENESPAPRTRRRPATRSAAGALATQATALHADVQHQMPEVAIAIESASDRDTAKASGPATGDADESESESELKSEPEEEDKRLEPNTTREDVDEMYASDS